MNPLKPCVIFFILGDNGPKGSTGTSNKLECKFKEGTGKLADCWKGWQATCCSCPDGCAYTITYQLCVCKCPNTRGTAGAICCRMTGLTKGALPPTITSTIT